MTGELRLWKPRPWKPPPWKLPPPPSRKPPPLKPPSSAEAEFAPAIAKADRISNVAIVFCAMGKSSEVAARWLRAWVGHPAPSLRTKHVLFGTGPRYCKARRPRSLHQPQPP